MNTHLISIHVKKYGSIQLILKEEWNSLLETMEETSHLTQLILRIE